MVLRQTLPLLVLVLAACGSPAPRPLAHADARPGILVPDRPTAEPATPTPAPASPTPDVPRFTPAPAPLRPPTNPPPPPPPAPRLRVVGPGVDTPIVGSYGDCTGKAPVGWAGAYFDTCQPGTWVMAHPPFFGAMNGWGIGTQVTYFDGSGAAHVAHVTASRVFAPGSSGIQVTGWLHLQVCTQNVANSSVRVLDAA